MSAQQVEFIRGRTRMFGIVGDPIVQVRSPEMVTWEFHRRGIDALVVPLHVRQKDFAVTMPALIRLANFDGFLFTIPFKSQALPLADHIGAQGRLLGCINQLVRRADGGWSGDILDGVGCVTAFQSRGVTICGKRLLLLGLGGAGAAIAGAMAAQDPAFMHLYDLSYERSARVKAHIALLSPKTQVHIGDPCLEQIDILINATPVGMLEDARLPLTVTELRSSTVVFDAIVMPEVTPLLKLAQACGCTVIYGREMMSGQIGKLVDGFLDPGSVGTDQGKIRLRAQAGLSSL